MTNTRMQDSVLIPQHSAKVWNGWLGSPGGPMATRSSHTIHYRNAGLDKTAAQREHLAFVIGNLYSKFRCNMESQTHEETERCKSISAKYAWDLKQILVMDNISIILLLKKDCRC